MFDCATIAHVSGVPVEELAPLMAGPGGLLLLWLRTRLSPRRDA